MLAFLRLLRNVTGMPMPRPRINRKAFIEARTRAGVSVADLSAATGIHPATIYRIEAGAMPRTPTVKKLADALGADAAAFIIIEDAA